MHGPSCRGEDALRRCHIFFERCLRLLDDTYLIIIFNENVVDAFPSRAICPGAMNQNYIPDASYVVFP